MFLRGRAQWIRHQPPLAWLLSLFTLAVVVSYLLFPFCIKNYLVLLPLATLAVVLSVFGVADLIVGVGERIRLQPPDEEQVTIVQE